MSHLVPGLQIWSWVCVRSFLFFTLNHSSFMQSNINLKIGSFEFECMFIPFTCFGWSWIYSLDGSKPCVFLECIGLKAFAFVSWNKLAEWNDRELPKPKLATHWCAYLNLLQLRCIRTNNLWYTSLEAMDFPVPTMSNWCSTATKKGWTSCERVNTNKAVWNDWCWTGSGRFLAWMLNDA